MNQKTLRLFLKPVKNSQISKFLSEGYYNFGRFYVIYILPIRECPKKFMFKFWETVPKNISSPQPWNLGGMQGCAISHLTTCGLPHFHIRFPPPLFHLFTFLFLSLLCTPEAYTPINCYMQNTINILCPNRSLLYKKLLSRESSDLDISKINRSRSYLY